MSTFIEPCELRRDELLLTPLTRDHAAGLVDAAADGELWNLRFTSVPAPGEASAYIAKALEAQGAGTRLPFAVIDTSSGTMLGTTSYHDLVPEIRRAEIGYTFYRASVQGTHVNTTCKLMLLQHAFERCGCPVVGWRTDGRNVASQNAIAKLGAHHDGTIRHHQPDRDGKPRDAVFFSMLADEWPAARDRLEERRERLLKQS